MCAREVLAAFPGRGGNAERERILKDSRDRPWSEAEREAHRQLRKEGITGWETNFSMRTQAGNFIVDIAFPEAKVALGIDGFEFHSSRHAFENDRLRHNALTAEGWQVLHCTWAQITSGQWLEALRRCLA
ncbi:MAG TPA: DUF559 domain-containing protein [Propionibacterium sp.]|nr:DUF559 domain-containing protein [Propionibacterium sp.]